jgi:hypothetical protein
MLLPVEPVFDFDLLPFEELSTAIFALPGLPGLAGRRFSSSPLNDVLLDVLSDFLIDVLTEVLADFLTDVLSDTLSNVLLDVLSDTLSNVLTEDLPKVL